MTAISQALNAGYSAQHILKYLSQNNPKLAQKISTALNAGHAADHVLSFLSRSEKKLGSFFPEKKEQDRSSNLYKTAQSSIHPSLTGAAKFAGATAATLGGAYALSRAVPSMLARSAVQGGAPQIPPGGPSAMTPGPNTPGVSVLGQGPQAAQPPQPPQPGQPPLQTQQAPGGPVNSPTVARSTQATAPGVNTVDVSEILTKHESKVQVDDMIKAGNNPDTIEGFFRKFHPQVLKNIEKESRTPFKKLVEEYAAQAPQQQQPEKIQDAPVEEQSVGFNEAFDTLKEGGLSHNLYEGILKSLKAGKDTVAGVRDPLLQAAKPAYEAGQIKSVEDLKKFSEFYEESKKQPEIEKSSLVSSPNGVGTVKEVRNGQALVEIDGKLTKVAVEDLESEPEEIKRAEIIIKPEDIPENLRSAALGFVSVPKSRRDIDIMYGPSGTFYRYYRKDGKPISEDTIENLREGQTLPISTGDTYMGAFDASTADSRGTVAYHDLKAKAQSKEAVEHGVKKKGKIEKEEDDPSKEFWYEALESPFIHGFIDQFLKTLTARSREYQKAKKTKK